MIKQSELEGAANLPRSKMRLDRSGSFQRLRKAYRNEDGSLLLFGLILFLLMAVMGGIAVDLMRHEERRARLQSTIDRSVLAAASLSQTRDPKSVVEDYFAKAGLSQYLTSVTVDRGLNYRDVQATAKADVKPFIMGLIGVDNLVAPANSRAEQRVSNVEVSLVLDVSGSMGGSRITNLRPAAKEFVSTVLASADQGRVTVSIIPYNAQVNLGVNLMAQFNVAARHSSSYCVELPDNVFSTTSLSTTQSFVHNAHFDPFSGYYNSSVSLFNCSSDHTNSNATLVGRRNTVLAINDNQTELQNHIDALVVGGNTSIDLGVKWGALLLDPSAQPVVRGLTNVTGYGSVLKRYDGRPLDPNTADVLKVLIVMTDGDNTTEYKINDPYNHGLSNIYRRNSNGALSAYFNRSSSSKFYRMSDNNWYTSPDGGTSGSTQLTWPQVWARYPVQYISYYLYSRAVGESYATWYYRFISYVSSIKDSRLQQICSAAKNSGIVVFGIGFEAPYGGREELRKCSTSDAHYFDASGLEISSAFRAIASNISQLRLTQ